MAKSKDEIIADIKAFITDNGGVFSEWCVGASRDANKSLLSDHKVDPRLDKWMFRTVATSAELKDIVQYFTTIRGATGTKGGMLADKVYVYRKSPRTNP